LLICGVVAVLGLTLGACSSSGDGLLSQANLMGDSSDSCGNATGVPTGLAALNGHAAYAQCMQDHYASGQMGYDEEQGHFAPGSHATSLLSN
jgi:hypothetical protein